MTGILLILLSQDGFESDFLLVNSNINITFFWRASVVIGRAFISRELENYFLHDDGCIWGTSIRCNIENN